MNPVFEIEEKTGTDPELNNMDTVTKEKTMQKDKCIQNEKNVDIENMEEVKETNQIEKIDEIEEEHKQLSELSESTISQKRKSFTMSSMFRAKKKKRRTSSLSSLFTLRKRSKQLFYIITSELYLRNKRYKIGGLPSADEKDMVQLLAELNKGKSHKSDNIFFYAFTAECHDYKEVSNILKDSLPIGIKTALQQNENEVEVDCIKYDDECIKLTKLAAAIIKHL